MQRLHAACMRRPLPALRVLAMDQVRRKYRQLPIRILDREVSHSLVSAYQSGTKHICRLSDEYSTTSKGVSP